jgi:hypothetical protein
MASQLYEILLALKILCAPTTKQTILDFWI